MSHLHRSYIDAVVKEFLLHGESVSRVYYEPRCFDCRLDGCAVEILPNFRAGVKVDPWADTPQDVARKLWAIRERKENG